MDNIWSIYAGHIWSIYGPCMAQIWAIYGPYMAPYAPINAPRASCASCSISCSAASASCSIRLQRCSSAMLHQGCSAAAARATQSIVIMTAILWIAVPAAKGAMNSNRLAAWIGSTRVLLFSMSRTASHNS